MPRSGRLRRFICEFNESPKAEKISFIPPFFILFIELILLFHAITIDVPNLMVVELTLILLVISTIEIIIVSFEIHQHYLTNSLERDLTIRLDDFILESKIKNVKKIVEEFIDRNPCYKSYRNKVYSIACQIMETHTKELWEKTLRDRLKRYSSKNDYQNVKDLVSDFIDKYPEYKKDPDRVYPIAARFMNHSMDETKKSFYFRVKK